VRLLKDASRRSLLHQLVRMQHLRKGEIHTVLPTEGPVGKITRCGIKKITNAVRTYEYLRGWSARYKSMFASNAITCHHGSRHGANRSTCRSLTRQDKRRRRRLFRMELC
jgi:hypothetical protein